MLQFFGCMIKRWKEFNLLRFFIHFHFWYVVVHSFCWMYLANDAAQFSIPLFFWVQVTGHMIPRLAFPFNVSKMSSLQLNIPKLT